MCELLLQYKANPNLQNFVTGRTPLHYAVDCGYYECVRILLKYEGNPLLKDSRDHDCFALCKDDEIKYLLENYKNMDTELIFAYCREDNSS
jgi:ankyrin repeat protein|mmetsp:Transcript_23989/g.4012  ORF Transcript_23989/g.4012 Transcript_23989/m.4012 type:complete len:91 (-) Transcript_23989:534-806(-)